MQDLWDDLDNDYEDFLKLATVTTEAKNVTPDLSETDLVDLQAIHDSVAELLKHFWMCFPPTNPDMDEKVSLFCRIFVQLLYPKNVILLSIKYTFS